MITRMFVWGAVLFLGICGLWYWLDPLGFLHNPVLDYLNDLMLRVSGYHR